MANKNLTLLASGSGQEIALVEEDGKECQRRLDAAREKALQYEAEDKKAVIWLSFRDVNGREIRLANNSWGNVSTIREVIAQVQTPESNRILQVAPADQWSKV